MKLLTAAFLFVSLNASAHVVATPSYSDVGSVPAGRSVSTQIRFINYSNIAIQFFNAHCSGDSSVFSCYSNCFQLLPYGSCTVDVRFTPRNGDGLRKMVWVNGSGGGWFATSSVYGTDARKNP